MTRPWPTLGNFEFARAFQSSVLAHIDRPAKEAGKNDESLKHRQTLHAATAEYHYLEQQMLAKPIPARELRKNEYGQYQDESEFLEPDHFTPLIAGDIACLYGRGGRGAACSISETMQIVNALAHPHGAERIYYRGEHQYGYQLKSRAQRSLEKENGGPLKTADGITDREIEELRRFQRQTMANEKLLEEIFGDGPFPHDDDPEWLPIMQHYDTSFGTRLLDITSSIFAGLHFACIGWDGSIDFETDGLLYIFFGHGRYYRYEPDGSFDDEISEFVPKSISDSFKNWKHPEYVHHFASKQHSRRELAQDGFFLVQGDLSVAPVYGGTAQFKICIPWWAKRRIIEELWFAGYTPERIVRGQMGLEAANTAQEQLDCHKAKNCPIDIPYSRRVGKAIKRAAFYSHIYKTNPKNNCRALVNLKGIIKNQFPWDANRIHVYLKELDALDPSQFSEEAAEKFVKLFV